MFQTASAFNQPVEAWDVSQVTNMWVRRRPASGSQGSGAYTAAQGSGHKPRACAGVEQYMFQTASAFNQPLEAWDVSQVISMYVRRRPASGSQSFTHSCARGRGHILCACAGAAQYMFRDASSFDQCLAAWNVGRVTNMAVRRPPVCRARAHIAAQGRAATSHVHVLARRRVCSTSRVQHIL